MSRRVVPLVVAAMIAAVPFLGASTYHLRIGVLMALYTFIALGMNLLLGNAGQISLGQAGFYGIGAYTTAILSTTFGWPYYASLPSAVAFAAFWGYVVGAASLRLSGHYLAMATLGFGLIVEAVILEWSELTGGPGGFQNIPPIRLAGVALASERSFYYLAWGVVAGCFVFTRNVVHSRVGRALAAIHDSEEAAAVLGISAAAFKLKIFVLSAVYAGLAGALYAHFAGVLGPASFSFILSITVLVMVVVGGLGTPWGSLVGAVLLTALPEVLRYVADVGALPMRLRLVLSDYTYHLVAYGIIVIAVIILVPGGIVGGLRALQAGRVR